MLLKSCRTYGDSKMKEGQNNSDSESELARGQCSPVEQLETENSAGNSQDETDRAVVNQNVTENVNPNS